MLSSMTAPKIMLASESAALEIFAASAASWTRTGRDGAAGEVEEDAAGAVDGSLQERR